MDLRILFFAMCLLMSACVTAQDITIEGYTYASGNRGFVSSAKVNVYDGESLVISSFSNRDGLFTIELPKKDSYRLEIEHELYKSFSVNVDCSNTPPGEKTYIKAEMHRSPGYLFEVTMAEQRVEGVEAVDAINGARIDVYNNTTEKEVFVLDEHVDPHFSVPLIKGNHYTILIRKEGFIAKRVEAFVDVEGCILCFEGLGTVSPGVTDNLSEGNLIGVLLANVTLERVFSGKTIVLQDLYYGLGQASLNLGAKKELNKLIRLMNENPEIKVELGSHTDARGSDKQNMDLSKRRAESAVSYLIKKGVDSERIVSNGYGETKLRNKCADGVQCTETQHGYNRRTEIKILEVDKSSERVKSLAELIMMEKGEKELEEFAFGGQIKVEGPDEINEEKLDSIVTQVGAESVSASELPSETISEQTAYDEIYYTVVIHESTTQIEYDHTLYKRHSGLEEIKVSDAIYKYVVGKYLNLKEAQDFFNTSIKAVYPDAQLHKYHNGQLIK